MPIEGATLHDQLSEAYDKTVGATDTATPAAVTTDTTSAAAAPQAPPAAGDAAATEQRARDEAGRFVKQDEKARETATPAVTAKPTTTGVVAAPVVEKLGVKRPDSWKKELWPIWDKLDAGESLTREERKLFMEYLPQREGEYLKGVSTYKAEAEHARRVNEALAPFQPLMQQQNITPERFITALASTHQTLSSGSPQDKLKAFARFAQDYAIPLNELLVQGEDGKVYLNQQYFQAQQQESPAALSQQDIDKRVDQRMQQMMLQRAVQEFKVAKDASGQLLHPHFDEVGPSMDGLLRSGLASDLPSAYDAALRLPKHQALFDGLQQQKQKVADEAKAKEEAERVARARANAASPRTSTPTGSVGGTGKKGLREALEYAYDTHVTGRI